MTDKELPVTETVNEEGGDKFTCWCGATGKYEELFEPLPTRCGGYGVVECYCGGDLCVCHNHGEQDCLGCKDCEGFDEDDWHDD